MSVLATLLFSLSLLAGIIFLILCVATKMQKKIVKPQYSKGLLISVITLFFSFMLVLIFTPTQTETKKESKPKKKVETVTSTPESTDTTTTTDDNSPTEEERINKFVEEAKTVTQTEACRITRLSCSSLTEWVDNQDRTFIFLSKENDCRRKASALYTGGNKIHY